MRIEHRIRVIGKLLLQAKPEVTIESCDIKIQSVRHDCPLHCVSHDHHMITAGKGRHSVSLLTIKWPQDVEGLSELQDHHQPTQTQTFYTNKHLTHSRTDKVAAHELRQPKPTTWNDSDMCFSFSSNRFTCDYGRQSDKGNCSGDLIQASKSNDD